MKFQLLTKYSNRRILNKQQPFRNPERLLFTGNMVCICRLAPGQKLHPVRQKAQFPFRLGDRHDLLLGLSGVLRVVT